MLKAMTGKVEENLIYKMGAPVRKPASGAAAQCCCVAE
jgi:hypothetical protein